jgi:5'(3')-deoxyribonucleotidase
MKRPKIAFDADEVFFPFMRSVTTYLNALYGTEFVWHEAPSMANLHERWGLSRAECDRHIDELMREDGLAHQEAVPLHADAEELRHLARWSDLSILTARDESQMSIQTHRWFNEWFGDVFSEIVMVGNPFSGLGWRSKAEVCVERGYVALVDDSIGSLLEVHARGIHAIRFGHYGWNRHYDETGLEIDLPPGMDDARDLSAVKDILVKRYWHGEESRS